MPVYNTADFIAEVLDSLPATLGEDFEVILVDDCSTDSTAEVIRRHARSSRIKLLKTSKNSGPATARNLGASQARGDFLFFDADILFLPDTLDRVKAYVQANPDVRCFSGISSKDSAGEGLNSQFHALYTYFALDLIPENSGASAWNPRGGFIKKDLFDSLGGFDTRYRKADVEDYELSKRILQITPIVFTRTLEVKHRFGGFWDSTRNFFKRSRQWINLLFRTRALEKTGHTRLSNVPNLVIPALMTAAVFSGPFFPVGKILLALIAAHVVFNLPEFVFFIKTSGLASATVFLFMILYYHWVALLGISLGLMDIGLSFFSRTREPEQGR
jgi:glycosyltransferase involved in cell wall biosynthesis